MMPARPRDRRDQLGCATGRPAVPARPARGPAAGSGAAAATRSARASSSARVVDLSGQRASGSRYGVRRSASASSSVVAASSDGRRSAAGGRRRARSGGRSPRPQRQAPAAPARSAPRRSCRRAGRSPLRSPFPSAGRDNPAPPATIRCLVASTSPACCTCWAAIRRSRCSARRSHGCCSGCTDLGRRASRACRGAGRRRGSRRRTGSAR